MTMTNYAPPMRTIGDTRFCATTGGSIFPSATGDGTRDDTDAINAAFAALPPEGGEVHLTDFGGSERHYMIDPERSIRPRSNTRLRLDPKAILIPKPTSLPRAYLLSCRGINNFELIGGMLVGDRGSYLPRAGTTDEWRHAIACYACASMTFRDAILHGWVGDGMSIGGATPCEDIAIAGIVSTGNRRQGLSIVNARGVYVHGSEFSFTSGTNPQCGIDIEPELNNVAADITIDTCELKNNARYGINMEYRSNGGPITNVNMRNCRVDNNGSNGIVINRASSVTIRGGSVDHNSATGINILAGSDHVRIGQEIGGPASDRVTFQRNYARQADHPRNAAVVTGWNSSMERDILIHAGADALVLANALL